MTLIRLGSSVTVSGGARDAGVSEVEQIGFGRGDRAAGLQARGQLGGMRDGRGGDGRRGAWYGIGERDIDGLLDQAHGGDKDEIGGGQQVQALFHGDQAGAVFGSGRGHAVGHDDGEEAVGIARGKLAIVHIHLADMGEQLQLRGHGKNIAEQLLVCLDAIAMDILRAAETIEDIGRHNVFQKLVGLEFVFAFLEEDEGEPRDRECRPLRR